MNSKRSSLPIHAQLALGGIDYTVLEVLGAGSNAIAYRASYVDQLQPELTHTVIVKELFPHTPDGGIRRAEDLSLCVDASAREMFELHKISFLSGNRAHLSLLKDGPAGIGGHINSFEAGNTLYSVLTWTSGYTLEKALGDGLFTTLRDKILVSLSLLDALRLFHENGLLHLDISPDNFYMTPFASTTDELQSRVMLIDFNSVSSLENLTGNTGFYYSVKASYSAPEVRLRQRAAIGPHTDLFSVCATIYCIVCGVPLPEQAACRGLGAVEIEAIERACAGYSPTVAHQLVSLLKKGLRLSPSRRYQSISALREALIEARDRIDGLGITHSAIWDAGRALALSRVRDPNAPQFPVRLQYEGEQIEGDRAGKLVGERNLLITGDGGIGKTTLLLDFLAQSVAGGYSASRPAFIYIPLAYFKGGGAYLQKAILHSLKYADEPNAAHDALGRLRRLLRQPLPGTAPAFVLLLDGINEVSGNIKPLLEEIDEFSRLGVRIVATSRAVDALRIGLAGFVHASILPLSEETVVQNLRALGMTVPDDASLMDILRNPMMLSLHVATARAEGAEAVAENRTRADIIAAYLSSLKQAHMGAFIGDERQQLLAALAIDHLLPAIAAACDRAGGPIPLDRAYAVTEGLYKNIREKSFALTFPDFMGKSRLVLEGLRDAREFFDLIISGVLCGGFHLLLRGGDNAYTPAHAYLTDTLAPVGRENWRRLRARQWKRRLPLAVAGAGLLLAAIIGGAALLPPRGPDPPDPYLLLEAAHRVDNSMTGLALLVDAEQSMLESARAMLHGDVLRSPDFHRVANQALALANSALPDALTDKGNEFRQDFDAAALHMPEGFGMMPECARAYYEHAQWVLEHVPLLMDMMEAKGEQAVASANIEATLDAYGAYLLALKRYYVAALYRVVPTLEGEMQQWLRNRTESPEWRSYHNELLSIPQSLGDDELRRIMTDLQYQLDQADTCLHDFPVAQVCVMKGR